MRLLCCMLIWLTLPLTPVVAEDWPQWRGTHRDGVWREPLRLDELTEENVETLWRQPLGGGYSGPTVADDRVFVMDRQEEPEQVERVLCFDAPSGTPLWTREYPCLYSGIGYTTGPRASVTIDDSRAYALGSMGHLHCLDVGDGTVLWSRSLDEDYDISTDERATNRMPMWGIAASPLIYDDLVIIHLGGRDGACVVAFDKRSGEEAWRALNDRGQYSSPILVRQAGTDVVVVWTGDSVAGLSPSDGEVYWRFPFAPVEMPIGIATPVVAGDTLFFTSFYDGSLMLRMRQDRLAVEPVWQARGTSETRTEALHSIISTPVIINDHIYGVDSHGELRCLEASTGERVWEDGTAVPRSRWGTIHFVQQEDLVWMFTERGDLVLASLSPEGYLERGRVHVIDPTTGQLNRRGGVCWSHPAFADDCIYFRNDEELLCIRIDD